MDALFGSLKDGRHWASCFKEIETLADPNSILSYAEFPYFLLSEMM
jgi:hypothetical protein